MQLILLLLMVHFSCNQEEESNVCKELEIYQRARIYNLEMKYDSTLNYLNNNPTSSENLYIIKERAFAHFGNYKADSAWHYTNTILLKDPKNIWAWYLKANMFYESEKHDSVVTCIDSAIKFKGGVVAYVDCKMSKEFFFPCSFDVEMPELRWLRGMSTIYTKKNYKQAYDDFKFCIQNKYRLDESYYNRAYLLYLSGEHKLARKDFEEAMKFAAEDDLGLDTLISN